MRILLDIPDSNIPKKQEIITVPIHFIDGIVCEAGGLGFYELPKGHGRLIDADEAIETLQSLGNRGYRREKGTIQEAIKMLSFDEYIPTIVEAERKE